MGLAEILDSTSFLVSYDNPEKIVYIDSEELEKTAKSWTGQELTIPKWDAPVFIQEKNKDAFRQMFVGNSINYQYYDHDTRIKYEVEYSGIPWQGAFGMWACLKRAYKQDKDFFVPEKLEKMNIEDIEKVFRGSTPMPFLESRLNVFNEIGRTGREKYDNDFYNVYKYSNGYLFNDGKGMIDMMTRDFPSYNDSVIIDEDMKKEFCEAGYETRIGQKIMIHKRAVLQGILCTGKFRNNMTVKIRDVEQLPIAANYVLPAYLRAKKIMMYEKGLDEKIRKGIPLMAWSPEETSIRANALHAFDKIIRIMNEDGGQKINACHVDYKAWWEGRNMKNVITHLTIPTERARIPAY